MKGNLEYNAMYIATEAHNRVNQTYGNKLPYTFHLELVVRMAEKYINLIPNEDRDIVRAACWLHDTLEDTFLTYNGLKKSLLSGLDTLNPDKVHQVVEIVFALTNNKGRNRKERADKRYYEGIRNTQYATFVKLCDRMANVLFSCIFGSSQFEMYLKENYWFHQHLFDSIYEVMFDDLDQLFRTKSFTF